MIELEVKKNEDESKIGFVMNGKFYDFNYESFEKLIESALKNDEEINIMGLNEYEEYKKLLNDIINGCRTDDFKNAVASAKEALTEIETESNLIKSELEGEQI
jgi:hypothetical protein